MPVAEQQSQNLRIYPEPPATGPQGRSALELIGSLPDLGRAVHRATGWRLSYRPGSLSQASRQASRESGESSVDSAANDASRAIEISLSAPAAPGVGVPPGRLVFEPEDGDGGSIAHPLDPRTMHSVGSALVGVLDELLQTRRALWQREAELAAGVPVVPHPDESGHLAQRLEAVLRGGAEAVGCQAAAIYLLDDATTQLKLRSCWGLPFDRLTAPARRLQGATADLEAMLGHAVVLDDALVMRHWNPPEDFPSAVCIPIASPTTILGTMWVFSDERRDFTEQQTNILEVVAGRVAADLEREVMRREGSDTAQLRRQLDAAAALQRSHLPAISPLLDGWELAGWNQQADQVGGDFYDWFCLPGGLLAVAAGSAMERGVEAALAASALKAALRAHGQYHREAQRALSQLNLTLWTASAGDQYASLFYGLVETATGRMSFCSAGSEVRGQIAAMVVNRNGCHQLETLGAPLGEGPETPYDAAGYELRPGEWLVLASEGLQQTRDTDGNPLGPTGLARWISPRRDLSADAMLRELRSHLEPLHPSRPLDRSLLLIKRSDA
jgi:serine phosphatase RsbU (regulator of sigma subunit)